MQCIDGCYLAAGPSRQRLKLWEDICSFSRLLPDSYLTDPNPRYPTYPATIDRPLPNRNLPPVTTKSKEQGTDRRTTAGNDEVTYRCFGFTPQKYSKRPFSGVWDHYY